MIALPRLPRCSSVFRTVENKLLIVKLKGLEPLIRLMLSPNVEVQCNAVGCVTNLATHGEASQPGLDSFVTLMLPPALALRNLASDEKYQIEIVRFNGLPPLLRLLRSNFLPFILSAAAYVRNVSIHPLNEHSIVDAGFLPNLIDLLSHQDNGEIQCHAISTLRNLAASSERNKAAIVEAGAVERIKELVLNVPHSVQSEMTACAAVLALSENLKPQLLEMGICEVLIPLTASPSVEVQGNLSAKSDDYGPFNAVWSQPDGGLHG